MLTRTQGSIATLTERLKGLNGDIDGFRRIAHEIAGLTEPVLQDDAWMTGELKEALFNYAEAHQLTEDPAYTTAMKAIVDATNKGW